MVADRLQEQKWSGADGDTMCETRRRAGGGSSGECSCTAAKGPTERVPEGAREAPTARSSGSTQEASTLPTHTVPGLTLEAFSLREAPSSGKRNKAAPNKRETLHPLAPACHLPSSSLVRGQAGSNSRTNSLVKAERAEARLCPQESCRHHLPDWHHNWCPCFLKHPS